MGVSNNTLAWEVGSIGLINAINSSTAADASNKALRAAVQLADQQDVTNAKLERQAREIANLKIIASNALKAQNNTLELQAKTLEEQAEQTKQQERMLQNQLRANYANWLSNTTDGRFFRKYEKIAQNQITKIVAYSSLLMPLLSEDITQEENRRIAEVEERYNPRIEEERRDAEAVQKAKNDKIEKYNREQRVKYYKELKEAEERRKAQKPNKIGSFFSDLFFYLGFAGLFATVIAVIWDIIFFIVTRVMALFSVQNSFRFWAESTLKPVLIIGVIGFVVFMLENIIVEFDSSSSKNNKNTIEDPDYIPLYEADLSNVKELEKRKAEECEKKRRDVAYVAPLTTDWACIEDINQYLKDIQAAIDNPEENLPRIETLPSLQTIVPSVEWIPEWAERTRAEVQKFTTIEGITVPTI